VLRQIKLGILWIWSLLQITRLKWLGVEVPWDCWILGTPRIKRHPGSTIRIGRRVSLFSAAFANPLGPQTKSFLHTMAPGALIEIGDDAGISSSTIVARERIRIGARTIIGADCLVVDNDFHSLEFKNRRNKTQDFPEVREVLIGKDCFVGARAIILKGAQLQDRSILGGGSVLTKKTGKQEVWSGNPATCQRILNF
jgi:acetyltransferase-like isoleucine patch superfamily enzyme